MLHTLPRMPDIASWYGLGNAVQFAITTVVVAVAVLAAVVIIYRFVRRTRWAVAFEDTSGALITLTIIALMVAIVGGSVTEGVTDSNHFHDIRNSWAEKFVAASDTEYGIDLAPADAITLDYSGGKVDAVVGGQLIKLELVRTANNGRVLTGNGSLLNPKGTR